LTGECLVYTSNTQLTRVKPLSLTLTIKNKGMRMSDKKHVILTNIDTELWAKFKGTCYTHGQSMNEVVSRLIKSYINKKS